MEKALLESDRTLLIYDGTRVFAGHPLFLPEARSYPGEQTCSLPDIDVKVPCLALREPSLRDRVFSANDSSVPCPAPHTCACTVSTDMRAARVADVVVHGMLDPHLRDPATQAAAFHPPWRRETQIWVGIAHEESAAYYPHSVDPAFLANFDTSVGISPDAHQFHLNPFLIDAAMLFRANLDDVRTPRRPADLRREAVFMASNCESRSGREQYVRRLMPWYPVHSVGSCLNNVPRAASGLGDNYFSDGGAAEKRATLGRYMFTLALENSVSHGYVSEKPFDALFAGSIPIYLGHRASRKYFPPRSVIFLDDFASMKELGLFLHDVSTNEALFESFHHWRTLPEADLRSWADSLSPFRTHTEFLGHLCADAQAKRRGGTTEDTFGAYH